MRGERYVHATNDRVVVTWDQSEPTGGQQDFTFEPTPHLYQAVLHAGGQIDLSYREMTARDALVGVYAVPASGAPATQPIDFSALDPSAAPAPAIFEGFHHHGLPRAENLACTVIDAFGDEFDFMVWYSDFRVDDQEAGTRSDGDISQEVEGLGLAWMSAVEPRTTARTAVSRSPGTSRCGSVRYRPTRGRPTARGVTTTGRWPRSVTSTATAGRPGRGRSWTAIPSSYAESTYPGPCRVRVIRRSHSTIRRRTRTGRAPTRARSWEARSTRTTATARSPSSTAAPCSRPPGSPTSSSTSSADRIDITVEDVIAHNGPRVPSFEDAPKDFSTAFVAVVLPGRNLSPELLERTEGIRRQWIRYWETVTGGVGTMSTSLGGG